MKNTYVGRSLHEDLWQAMSPANARVATDEEGLACARLLVSANEHKSGRTKNGEGQAKKEKTKLFSFARLL